MFIVALTVTPVPGCNEAVPRPDASVVTETVFEPVKNAPPVATSVTETAPTPLPKPSTTVARTRSPTIETANVRPVPLPPDIAVTDYDVVKVPLVAVTFTDPTFVAATAARAIPFESV